MKTAQKQNYTDQVINFIETMEDGKRYNLAAFVKSENMERFIEIVKWYMRNHPWQGGLNFDKGYTTLYKIGFPYASGKIPGFVYAGKIYRGEVLIHA